MNRFSSLAATLAGLLAASGVQAAPPGDLPGALGKCAGIADSQGRLACYDDLARAVNPPTAEPSMHIAAPAAPTAPVVEHKKTGFGTNGVAPQTTPQQFGSERLAQPPAQEAEKAKEIDGITATLTEYAKNPFGKFIVFLDNGQVWRQLQGDSGEARFNRNPKDNKVTISRAIFGSYSMLLNDSVKTYKVERIK
jgi:hypothetical protein